ncbi:MAG: sugar transferase [Planctomycetota bacterium]
MNATMTPPDLNAFVDRIERSLVPCPEARASRQRELPVPTDRNAASDVLTPRSVRFTATCRRGMDIAVSGATLFVLAPLMLIVMLLIRLESRGPVFFVQERVGKRGRRFRMLKFRSMYVDAEQMRASVIQRAGAEAEVRFKARDDPRITRVGRFLRRTSMDELPQLWNVLRGEMALVGPRPPIPEETALYTSEQWRRLDVHPGLTCTWQVGGRSDLPFERQVQMDIEYIRDRTLWTDLRILFQTIPAVATGRGAY